MGSQGLSGMVIEVGNWPLDLRTVPGGTRKDGSRYESFTVRTQIAQLHMAGSAPRELKIRLSKDQQPHAAGRYALGVGSFYLKDGELQVRQELELVPLPAPAAVQGDAKRAG